MNEIEVKARVSGFETIKDKLEKMGCVFSEPLLQDDRIYLHRSLEFPDIKRGTVVLRIRDSNGTFLLTLKQRLVNELAKIEKEITISDPDQADEILQLMDFHEVVRVSKKRIKCKYQAMEICLDEVNRLGSFIEVERLTMDGNHEEIQAELFDFLKTLGVQPEDQIFKGYDTLVYELNPSRS